MLIQSKIMNTTIDKLREVVDRYRQQCDDRLTEALKDADDNGREELLYSDAAELEILDAQTQALRIALREVEDADGNG
jgi:ribosomal protein L32E